jgi:hypothetical protein
MIYQYVVTLKNKTDRYTDRFSLLVLLVSVLLFIKEQLVSANIRITYLFGALAIAAIIIRNTWLALKDQRTVYYGSALFIAGISWVTMPYLSWLFLPFALMGLFERQAKMQLEVGFNETGIVLNTLIRKRYHWNDLSNVVLKDDVLTIDFKNNRLLQRETIDDESDTGEDEFNGFCARQLRLVDR